MGNQGKERNDMMKLNLGEEVHLFDEMLLHGGLRIVGKVMKKRNEMMKSLMVSKK